MACFDDLLIFSLCSENRKCSIKMRNGKFFHSGQRDKNHLILSPINLSSLPFSQAIKQAGRCQES